MKNCVRKWVLVGSILVFLTGCNKSADVSRLFEEEDLSYETSTDVNVEADVAEPADDMLKETLSNVIYVQIDGAVSRPGVYEVSSGSRVFVLIELAGGFTDEASTSSINQVAWLEDGQQIYVPTQQEASIAYESMSQQEDGKVNINNASKQELTQLPGIGERKAELIIEYREKNGKFSSIDEIMNINGIKEGVFDTIKELITV